MKLWQKIPKSIQERILEWKKNPEEGLTGFCDRSRYVILPLILKATLILNPFADCEQLRIRFCE